MEFNLGFNWIFHLSWSNIAVMNSSSNNWLSWLRLRVRTSHLNIWLLRIGIWIDGNRVGIVDVRLLGLNLISDVLHLSTSSLSFGPAKLKDNNSQNCSSCNHSNFEYMIVSFSFPPSLLFFLISQILSIFLIIICLKFLIKRYRSLVLTMFRMSRPLMMFFTVGSLMIWLRNFLSLCLSCYLIQLLLGKRSVDSLAFDFLGGN